MFYVLRDGGNILSRHTCEKLGIISSEFPKVGEHLSGSVGANERSGLKVNVVENSAAVYQEEGVCDPDSELPCRCPRRELVDPPGELPFPATEDNRERLEDWIKEILCQQRLPCVQETGDAMHRGPPNEDTH